MMNCATRRKALTGTFPVDLLARHRFSGHEVVEEAGDVRVEVQPPRVVSNCGDGDGASTAGYASSGGFRVARRRM